MKTGIDIAVPGGQGCFLPVDNDRLAAAFMVGLQEYTKTAGDSVTLIGAAAYFEARDIGDSFVPYQLRLTLDLQGAALRVRLVPGSNVGDNEETIRAGRSDAETLLRQLDTNKFFAQ